MEENALWHKVTESEKEEIKKQARKIMEDFAGKLEKIKVEEKHFEKNSGMREEGDGWETIPGFKEVMLENAPDVNDNFIVAEKGGWK